jgi:hypothetical protein
MGRLKLDAHRDRRPSPPMRRRRKYTRNALIEPESSGERHASSPKSADVWFFTIQSRPVVQFGLAMHSASKVPN